MTTDELIARLQEIDPVGDDEIFIREPFYGDVFAVSTVITDSKSEGIIIE